MEQKHLVRVTATDRTPWHRLLRAGRAPTPMLTRARMLLTADSGPQGPAWTDEALQQAVDGDRSAVAGRKLTVPPLIFSRGEQFCG